MSFADGGTNRQKQASEKKRQKRPIEASSKNKRSCDKRTQIQKQTAENEAETSRNMRKKRVDRMEGLEANRYDLNLIPSFVKCNIVGVTNLQLHAR